MPLHLVDREGVVAVESGSSPMLTFRQITSILPMHSYAGIFLDTSREKL